MGNRNGVRGGGWGGETETQRHRGLYMANIIIETHRAIKSLIHISS